MVVSRSIITYTSLAVSTIIAFPCSVLAQQIQVDAPKEYSTNTPFSVTFILNNAKGNIQILNDPNFSGLEVVYPPTISSSSNVLVVNGQATHQESQQIQYTLLANRDGTFRISGLRLSVDGKEISAPPVSVKIIDSPSGQRINRRGTQAEYRYDARISKRSVYVQEPLPIVYTLRSTEVPRINNVSSTSYDGFISFNLFSKSERMPVVEQYKGKDWVALEIFKELLFPQRAGKLIIPKNELSVIYTHRDPENDLLNQTMPRTLSTDPIEIDVKPLPEEGKPADFSGAVGNFTVRYELSRKSWKSNEATSLKVILEGQGNLKIAKIPKLNLPQDIEIYDPTESSDQEYEQGKLHSIRTIEYSLIPRKEGNIKIPSLSLSYFNPATARYETTTAPEVSIHIDKGYSNHVETTIHTGKEGTNNTPFGITAGEGIREFGAKPWLIAFIHVTISLIGLFALSILRRYYRYTDDTLRVVADKANAVARKRLKTARKYLDDSNKEAFLEELLRSIWGYLGDKLKLPLSDLNRDNVTDYLIKQGIETKIIESLVNAIDQIEFARFAPASESDSYEALYEDVVTVLSHLEKNIR